MKEETKLIKEIVNRYDGETGMLIPMLQDLQAECGYLPAEQLRRLSNLLEVPLTRIYSVATFYSSFHLAPKGQHEVTLCMGTVCHLKGAGLISDTIRTLTSTALAAGLISMIMQCSAIGGSISARDWLIHINKSSGSL